MQAYGCWDIVNCSVCVYVFVCICYLISLFVRVRFCSLWVGAGGYKWLAKLLTLSKLVTPVTIVSVDYREIRQDVEESLHNVWVRFLSPLVFRSCFRIRLLEVAQQICNPNFRLLIKHNRACLFADLSRMILSVSPGKLSTILFKCVWIIETLDAFSVADYFAKQFDLLKSRLHIWTLGFVTRC